MFVSTGEQEVEGQTSSLSFYSLPSGGSAEGGADPFYLGSSDRMDRDGSKLGQGGFKLDIRKHFFTEGMVKH